MCLQKNRRKQDDLFYGVDTRQKAYILSANRITLKLVDTPHFQVGRGVPPNLLKAHGSHADHSLWLCHLEELHQPRASDLKRQTLKS